MAVSYGDNISEVTLNKLNIIVYNWKKVELQCTTVTNFGSDGKPML